METFPDWYRLIRHWQRLGNQGLTVPFLVGALEMGQSREGAADNVGDVRRLLELIREETPEGEVVRISLCSRLEQPVATLLRATQYRDAPADLKFRSTRTSRQSLIVEPRYGHAGVSTLEEVANALRATCHAALAERRYSYCAVLKSFRDMDAGDRQFIKAALAYDYENEV